MSNRARLPPLDQVRRRDKPGLWWRRPLSAGNTVMLIPIIDGIPVIHKFEIVDKSEIRAHEQEEPGRGA
jgi:hypothetical protein